MIRIEFQNGDRGRARRGDDGSHAIAAIVMVEEVA